MSDMSVSNATMIPVTNKYGEVVGWEDEVNGKSVPIPQEKAQKPAEVSPELPKLTAEDIAGMALCVGSLGILCVAGCSPKKPMPQEMLQALQEFKYSEGDQTATIKVEKAEVQSIGEAKKEGDTKVWPVKVFVNHGVCSVQVNTDEKYQKEIKGLIDFEARKIPGGKWEIADVQIKDAKIVQSSEVEKDSGGSKDHYINAEQIKADLVKENEGLKFPVKVCEKDTCYFGWKFSDPELEGLSQFLGFKINSEQKQENETAYNVTMGLISKKANKQFKVQANITYKKAEWELNKLSGSVIDAAREVLKEVPTKELAEQAIKKALSSNSEFSATVLLNKTNIPVGYGGAHVKQFSLEELTVGQMHPKQEDAQMKMNIVSMSGSGKKIEYWPVEAKVKASGTAVFWPTFWAYKEKNKNISLDAWFIFKIYKNERGNWSVL